MARFTQAGGSGSGAPGPQGPQGPAGEDAVLPQDLGTTDSPTFSKITLTNNGSTDNITIGDDVILGDGNVANHVVIIGQQDATQGGIVLGTNETEVVSSDGTNLNLTSDNDIVLNPGSTYAYIGTPQLDGSNRIAKMSDITGGPGANIADFIFTDNGGDSTITLPGDKEMRINAGADSDLYLTAGDDLYIQTLGAGDDIHLNAADDIRFTTNNENFEFETVYDWRMDSEGEFHLPGNGLIWNPSGTSGDGYGNDTLHLVPNDTDNETEQRIIIDPTAPNHIHIRAGGLQDYSNVELILGGERTGVRVSDTDGTTVVQSKQEDYTWSYQNVGEGGNVYVVATADAEPDYGDFTVINGQKFVISNVTRDQQNGTTSYETTPGIGFAPFENYTFIRDRGNHAWTFNRAGYLNGPTETGHLRVTGIINDDGDVSVISDTDNVSISSGQDININANDDLRITTFGGDYAWDFNSNGKLFGPGEDGALVLGGELVTQDVNMSIRSNEQSVVLNGALGEFLGSSDAVNNQIATIGDVANRLKGYGSYFSVSDQTCTAGSIQAMTFPVAASGANGVAASGTNWSQLLISNPGTYNIAFSAQLLQSNSQAGVYIWLNKNGSPIANSNTRVDISANDPYKVAAWNWFVEANANDYFEIMWRSDSNHTTLQYVSDIDIDIAGVPGVPSVIVTVNQVA